MKCTPRQELVPHKQQHVGSLEHDLRHALWAWIARAWCGRSAQGYPCSVLHRNKEMPSKGRWHERGKCCTGLRCPSTPRNPCAQASMSMRHDHVFEPTDLVAKVVLFWCESQELTDSSHSVRLILEIHLLVALKLWRHSAGSLASKHGGHGTSMNRKDGGEVFAQLRSSQRVRCHEHTHRNAEMKSMADDLRSKRLDSMSELR